MPLICNYENCIRNKKRLLSYVNESFQNHCFSEFSSRQPTPGWVQSISTSVRDLESDEFVSLWNIFLSVENTNLWFQNLGFFFPPLLTIWGIKKPNQNKTTFLKNLAHYLIIVSIVFYYYILSASFFPVTWYSGNSLEKPKCILILQICFTMFNSAHVGGRVVF